MASKSKALPYVPSAFPFRLKDPVSALTHFAACIAAILATSPLLIRAARHSCSTEHMISFSIFIVSMIFLYGASAAYHAFDVSEKGNRLLRKIDHMMIFVLIAGTYTPYCIIALPEDKGRFILVLQWSIALFGSLITLFFVNVPKWLSAIIYITMGWVCLLAFPDFINGLSGGAFYWLLSGGIIYTVGGVTYALKLKFLKHPLFGAHELFHIFVMLGSICHYVSVGYFMTAMA